MNSMKSVEVNCNVCGGLLNRPIYTSPRDLSITSLCQVWPVSTKIYFCECCGHVQTAEEINLESYYAEDYKILIDSEEEDQIYEVNSGVNVYRTDHQVKTFFSLVQPKKNSRILDFGCAKSATLKRLVEKRSDIRPHLFDVSDMYIHFWEQFVDPDDWSVHTTKDYWNGYFDIVTSFFSLEHAADAHAAMNKIASLLKPDGLLYAIVPNIFTNIADLIVVDHVNHFTEASLEYVLQSAGFSVLEINSDLHTGAFIILAKKDGGIQPLQQKAKVKSIALAVDEMVSFWDKSVSKVQEFENKQALNKPASIYGSGFYGTFIGTCLQDMSLVECVVDQNYFLHGRTLLDKKIIPPSELPPHIEVVYVGLNPKTAKNTIKNISLWNDRELQFFFL
jgi:SAM-dependent methyltransferase